MGSRSVLDNFENFPAWIGRGKGVANCHCREVGSARQRLSKFTIGSYLSDSRKFGGQIVRRSFAIGIEKDHVATCSESLK